MSEERREEGSGLVGVGTQKRHSRDYDQGFIRVMILPEGRVRRFSKTRGSSRAGSGGDRQVMRQLGSGQDTLFRSAPGEVICPEAIRPVKGVVAINTSE